ncbi:MAG: hypothetical protein AAGA27_06345 [Pseudomonadota bacterium]
MQKFSFPLLVTSFSLLIAGCASFHHHKSYSSTYMQCVGLRQQIIFAGSNYSGTRQSTLETTQRQTTLQREFNQLNCDNVIAQHLDNTVPSTPGKLNENQNEDQQSNSAEALRQATSPQPQTQNNNQSNPPSTEENKQMDENNTVKSVDA